MTKEEILALLNDALTQGKSAFLDIVTNELPEAMALAEDYLLSAPVRLALVVNYMTNTDKDNPETISEKFAFALARVDDEKNILESQLISFLGIAKVSAQNLANGLQDLLLKSISSVISAVVNK